MLAIGGSEGFLSDAGYTFELDWRLGCTGKRWSFLLRKQQRRRKCTCGARTLAGRSRSCGSSLVEVWAGLWDQKKIETKDGDHDDSE